jgi:NAD(P)H-nitrite reductase large subunit
MKHEHLIICRCEEITREDIAEAIRRGARSVPAVKRRTSAGMGLCHGRTCTRLVAQVVKEELGIPADKLKPATVRPPVRPILVSAFEKEGD